MGSWENDVLAGVYSGPPFISEEPCYEECGEDWGDDDEILEDDPDDSRFFADDNKLGHEAH